MQSTIKTYINVIAPLQNEPRSIHTPNENTIRILLPDNSTRLFHFDHVFPEVDNIQDVFQKAVLDLLDNFRIITGICFTFAD